MKRKPTRTPSKPKQAEPRSAPERLRSKMRGNVAEAVTLMIGRPGFEEVREILKEVVATGLSVAEQQRFMESLEKRIRLLEQRRENGQILAEEGREARRQKAEARAAKICRLYKTVRKSYADGRAGNGKTLAEVARQFGSPSDRERPITVQAIRKILKRCGVPCR